MRILHWDVIFLHQTYRQTPTSILFILPSFTYKKSHSFQSCNCSTDATFHTRTAQLATNLLKRGYNRNFVKKQIRRALDIPRQLTLQTKGINKAKRVPFITTFNPSLPHISHIIKKHFNLLHSSNRCKSVFQHPPVVAFRRSPNLRDLLVTARLPSNSANPQLPCGSFRCGKNCATCLTDLLHIPSFLHGKLAP